MPKTQFKYRIFRVKQTKSLPMIVAIRVMGIPYRDLGSDTEKPEATPELVGEFNASPQDVDEPEESSDLTVDESEKGAPDGIDAELRQ